MPSSVFDLPRAIHFDAHVMRILQQAGLADQVLPATRIWKRSTFYGADQQPIRVHEWPQERPLGWDEHYLFYQPALEQLLRDNLTPLDNVEVRLGAEVVRHLAERRRRLGARSRWPERTHLRS